MDKLVVQKQQILDNIARLQAGYRVTDDSDVYPGYSKPTTPFRPYNDYCVNLEDNPIENGDEHLTGLAEDSVIHKFISNLITNQALSLASNKEYHEEFDGRSAFSQEKIPNIYKVRPMYNESHQNNERLPRKKTRHGRQGQGQGRSRRSRLEEEFGDLPNGSEISVREGTLMIYMPLDVMRQYLYSEIESRVQNVHAYYKREWETINKERMATLAELVKVQETSRKLRTEMAGIQQTLKKYKDMCDNLGTKVETGKEAKRRRRQAKKQRKTEKTGAGDGKDDTATPSSTSRSRGVSESEESILS